MVCLKCNQVTINLHR